MSTAKYYRLVKPHLSVRIFKAYFEYLELNYPNLKIAELLNEIGLSLQHFENENNWVSVEFDSLFMNAIENFTRDPDISIKVSQFACSKTSLGPTITAIIKYGFSLDYVYSNVWRISKLLNKVVHFDAKKSGINAFTVTILPNYEGLSEYERQCLDECLPHIVASSWGYGTYLPNLHGLPNARVEIIKNEVGYTLEVFPPSSRSNADWIWPFSTGFFIGLGLLIYGESIMRSFLLGAGASFLQLFLKYRKRSLQSDEIAKETESNLRKLDEQYQDLLKTKTHLQRKLTESDAINKVTQNLSRISSEQDILESTCADISNVLGLDRSLIMLRDPQNKFLEFKAGHFEDQKLLQMLQGLKLTVDLNSDDPTKISNVYRFKKPILIADVSSHLHTLNKESQQVLTASGSKSFLAVPIATENESFGVIMADMVREHHNLTKEDLELLAVIGKQLAIAIEKHRATREIEEQATSYSRFVPWDLIRLLGAQKIKEIDTGKGVELDLTIVFCDIRGFTSMSEKMSPADSVKFLNSYYTNLAPTFQEHNGVIDKFLGDGIMALFQKPADALKASADYQRKLADYNERHRSGGVRNFIKTGFGIHSGKVLLGAIGYKDRLSISVVSDSVNLASRLDGLTKKFGVDVVCTEDVLASTTGFVEVTRKIAELKVEGRDSVTRIYELFAHLKPEEQQSRRDAAWSIENILRLLAEENFEQALQVTEVAFKEFPNDPVVQHYRKRLLAQFVNIEFKGDAA